jgi:uncharacterized membrane protein
MRKEALSVIAGLVLAVVAVTGATISEVTQQHAPQTLLKTRETTFESEIEVSAGTFTAGDLVFWVLPPIIALVVAIVAYVASRMTLPS